MYVVYSTLEMYHKYEYTNCLDTIRLSIETSWNLIFREERTGVKSFNLNGFKSAVVFPNTRKRFDFSSGWSWHVDVLERQMIYLQTDNVQSKINPAWHLKRDFYSPGLRGVEIITRVTNLRGINEGSLNRERRFVEMAMQLNAGSSRHFLPRKTLTSGSVCEQRMYT